MEANAHSVNRGTCESKILEYLYKEPNFKNIANINLILSNSTDDSSLETIRMRITETRHVTYLLKCNSSSGVDTTVQRRTS